MQFVIMATICPSDNQQQQQQVQELQKNRCETHKVINKQLQLNRAWK